MPNQSSRPSIPPVGSCPAWRVFAEDRVDGPVANLSYWVCPAFDRMPLRAPEFDSAGLARSGRRLVRAARFGPARWPSEWTSLAEAAPRPADGVADNALRIQFYLAMAGVTDAGLYAPSLSLWPRPDAGNLPLVDTASGTVTARLPGSG